MDFNTIKEKYPINNTIVGFFCNDYGLTTRGIEQLRTLSEDWFGPQEGYYPFILDNDGDFEFWSFGYFRVCGYYTSDNQGEDYQLVIYSEDFGFEIIDPFNNDQNHIIIAPLSNDDHDTDYQAMFSRVLQEFDPEGKSIIFTTYEDVLDFIN